VALRLDLEIVSDRSPKNKIAAFKRVGEAPKVFSPLQGRGGGKMSARKAAKGGALLDALKICQKITKSLMDRQDSGS
jgi:hypothetical protein